VDDLGHISTEIVHSPIGSSTRADRGSGRSAALPIPATADQVVEYDDVAAVGEHELEVAAAQSAGSEAPSRNE